MSALAKTHIRYSLLSKRILLIPTEGKADMGGWPWASIIGCDSRADDSEYDRMILVTCTEDGTFIVVDPSTGISVSRLTREGAEAEVGRIKGLRRAA